MGSTTPWSPLGSAPSGNRRPPRLLLRPSLPLAALGLGGQRRGHGPRQVLAGDRRHIPGAVRASCGLGTSAQDVTVLLEAVAELAGGRPAPVPYTQDPVTGDFYPEADVAGWSGSERPTGSACAAVEIGAR